MIVGVGVDVVDLGRFDDVLRRAPRLRARLFRADEQHLGIRELGSRFAVKEAVAKALGAPRGFRFTDAWIEAGPGPPRLALAGRAEAAACASGVTRWHVSRSYRATVAVALVIAESD